MRYSVKVFPGVRVYGGRSRYRRPTRGKAQASQPSGCGIVLLVVLALSAAYWLFGWPLMVFRHHWVTRHRVDCAAAFSSCSGFKITGYQWQLVHHNAPSVIGVVVEVIWVVLLLALGLVAWSGSLAAKGTAKESATTTSAQSPDDLGRAGGKGTQTAEQRPKPHVAHKPPGRRPQEPGDAGTAYAKAYAEFTLAALSMLAAVDTPESAQQFVTQVAQQIQNMSAKVPEFYAGEFINAFKDEVVDRARIEMGDCERAVSAAQAEADAVTAELKARLDVARAAGDRAAEHAVWGEREARQVACQSKMDAATHRIGLVGLRIDACKNLASALGFPFD